MQTLMKSNNFAMRDWHLEHVEKVVVRYIKGISPDASSFEKRNFKKYSTLSACAKQIEYDIKHGVTMDEALSVLKKIRHNKEFSQFQSNHEVMQRLDELERQLSAPKRVPTSGSPLCSPIAAPTRPPVIAPSPAPRSA